MNFIRNFCFVAVLFIASFGSSAYSQENSDPRWDKVDSLFELQATLKDQTQQEKILRQAEKIAEKAGYRKGLMSIYNRFGVIYYMHSEYSRSELYFAKGYKIAKAASDTIGMSRALNNRASVLISLGQEERALRIFKRALELHEANSPETYSLWFNIALIYKNLGNYSDAVKVFKKLLALDHAKGDTQLKCCNNLGIIYRERGQKDSSYYYLRKGISMLHDTPSPRDECELYNSLANLYSMSNQIDSAEYYFRRAVEIAEQNHYSESTLVFTLNLMVQMQKKGQHKDVIALLKELRKDYEESEDPRLQTEFYLIWAEAFYQAHQYRESCLGWMKYKKHKDHIDSLSSLEQAKGFSQSVESRLAAVRDSIHMAKKIQHDQVTLVKQQETLKRNQDRFIFFSVAGLLLLIALFFAFRNMRAKSKLADTLQHQNDQIQSQKNIIQQKNEELTDSIEYAHQLQQAILPSEDVFSKYFHSYGLIYLPRDIVAGDFYFCEEIEKDGLRHVIVAVADCTGHGVPGALVSVVCSNALTRSVKEFGLTDPGRILDKTRELVNETFLKSGQEVKDGMDISLASLQLDIRDSKFEIENKTESQISNLQSEIRLRWAGANNPIWLRKRSGEFFEIKGDKQPIGHFEYARPFKSVEVELEKGDQVLLMTDGFSDQFGGPRGKKLKSTRLREEWLSCSDLELNDQKSKLTQFFEEWKKDQEQTDDVCVLLLKV